MKSRHFFKILVVSSLLLSCGSKSDDVNENVKDRNGESIENNGPASDAESTEKDGTAIGGSEADDSNARGQPADPNQAFVEINVQSDREESSSIAEPAQFLLSWTSANVTNCRLKSSIEEELSIPVMTSTDRFLYQTNDSETLTISCLDDNNNVIDDSIDLTVIDTSSPNTSETVKFSFDSRSKTVRPGEQARFTVKWESTEGATCSIERDPGIIMLDNLNSSGQDVVYLSESATLNLTCQKGSDYYGAFTANLTVRVTDDAPPSPTPGNPPSNPETDRIDDFAFSTCADSLVGSRCAITFVGKGTFRISVRSENSACSYELSAPGFNTNNMTISGSAGLSFQVSVDTNTTPRRTMCKFIISVTSTSDSSITKTLARETTLGF